MVRPASLDRRRTGHRSMERIEPQSLVSTEVGMLIRQIARRSSSASTRFPEVG